MAGAAPSTTIYVSNQPTEPAHHHVRLANVHEQNSTAAENTSPDLCIDKRSGKKAYKSSFKNQTGIFNITGDPDKKTVDLTMHQNTITLTFTDKPILPPVAEKSQARQIDPRKQGRARSLERDPKNIRRGQRRFRFRRLELILSRIVGAAVERPPQHKIQINDIHARMRSCEN